MSAILSPSPKWLAFALRLAMASLWAIVLATPTCLFAQAPQPQTEKTVRIVIDYGDGVEKHFKRIPWRRDMTVIDAMFEAKKRERGLTFTHSGQGETAFVSAIDGLSNQGGGSGKRNWIYRVNGELARRGCGVQTIDASDTVIWAFSSSGLEP